METSFTLLPKEKIPDRFEEPWTPKTSLAINAMNSLKNMKSAPIQGHPKLGNLTRSRTDLNVRRPDLGLLDLFVDDGTNGSLDEGLRSLRFSAAASNINRLFTPKPKKVEVNAPTKANDKAQAQKPEARNDKVSTEPMAVVQTISTKEPKDEDFENSVTGKRTVPVEPTHGKCSNLADETGAIQPIKYCNSMNADTSTDVSKTPESLDAEPITPPPATYKQVEGTLGNEQSPMQESPGPGEGATNPRLSPAQLFKSTMQKARRLSSLFSKTSANSSGNGEGCSPGNPQDDSSAPKEEPAPSPKKTGSQLRQLLSKLSSGIRNRSNSGNEDDRGMQSNQRAKAGVMLRKIFKRKSGETEESEASPSDGAFTSEDNGTDTGPSSSPPPENRVQTVVKKVTEFVSMLVQ